MSHVITPLPPPAPLPTLAEPIQPVLLLLLVVMVPVSVMRGLVLPIIMGRVVNDVIIHPLESAPAAPHHLQTHKPTVQHPAAILPEAMMQTLHRRAHGVVSLATKITEETVNQYPRYILSTYVTTMVMVRVNE